MPHYNQISFKSNFDLRHTRTQFYVTILQMKICIFQTVEYAIMNGMDTAASLM